MTREEAIAFFRDMNECTYGNLEAVEMAIEALEQEPMAKQFAKWVATEIFDENWEYNENAFAEIACRKLAKLGIVRENGDKWELVDPPESGVAESNRTYCTECIYFADVIYEGQQWFGARCEKDGHSTMPSMYAIKSLHNDCPLVAEVEPQESEVQNDTENRIRNESIR